MHLSGRFLCRFAAALLIGCVSFRASGWSSAAERPSSQNEDIEAEILLGAARNALHLNDLDTAIQRFAEFIKKYPDRDDGRREYADLLFRTGQVQQALPEYERLLKRHPDDPQLTRSLVDALLNIGDHPRAKAQLIEAMRRFPDRVDFALSLALLHALDEETPEAEELVRRIIRDRTLDNYRMRLDAAALYVQLRRKQLAGPIVAELLRRKPHDARVLAIAVRYALLIGNHELAVRYANTFDRLYPDDVDVRLELASALYGVRRYAEAGRLFATVLKKAPKNEVALLGLARVALRDYRLDRADAFLRQVPKGIRGRQWDLVTVERDTISGNYLRAYRILTRLLQENPKDERASMALADLDRAENEFIKADSRYMSHDALGKNSRAGQHYSISLFLQYRHADAERMCRHVLRLDPEDTTTMVVLARTLVKMGRREEAAELMRRAQEADGRALPEGLYYSHFISPEFGFHPPGRPGEAPSGDSLPLHVAVTLVDLAMEDGRQYWAREVLDEALRIAPENIVLRTRLAEWYASFGLPHQAACAARIYEELLTREPYNQKWILGLARAKATMRCYGQSLALYQRLRRASPENSLVARESARVTFHACGTWAGRDECDSILCGWPGLQSEADRIGRECWAKDTHFCLPSVAADTYGDLVLCEPFEQHLAFELGQVHGIMGDTRNAIDAYSHLLSVNPNHRDAQVAIVGKWIDLRPELKMDHRYVRERGREGLTSIDRLGEFVGCRIPLADENEYVEFGYGRLSLSPTIGTGTRGDALVLKAQKQLHADFGECFSPYVPFALFLDCEVQRYDRYVSTRPVFEAGIKFRTCDDFVWTVSGTMQNVLENDESLLQDIYRGGLRVNLHFWPHNWWESDVLYALYGYSDHNLRHAAEFYNRIQLTPDPCRWTLLGDLVYWNFAETSIFSPGPDPYRNMIHPYWAPRDFGMTGVGLEYKRWLSWDRFDGGDHCWISFSVMKRWDSQNHNYTIYRGMLQWDITRRLSGYATGEYTDSSPYRSTRAYGGLSWKF